MRMECKTYKDAERLSHLYAESHIERKDGKCYLVVDKVKGKQKTIHKGSYAYA